MVRLFYIILICGLIPSIGTASYYPSYSPTYAYAYPQQAYYGGGYYPYYPAPKPLTLEQFPSLEKSLLFIPDAQERQNLWETFKQWGRPDLEYWFICQNIQRIRPAFNAEHIQNAVNDIKMILPQFNETKIMALLAILPDNQLKEALYRQPVQIHATEGTPVELIQKTENQAVKEINGRFEFYEFHHPWLLAHSVFSKNNINGFDTTMIVIDSNFEPDAGVNMEDWDESFDEKYLEDDMAHGSLVSACAASMDPTQKTLAYGAKVLPIEAFSHNKKTIRKFERLLTTIKNLTTLVKSNGDTIILLNTQNALLKTSTHFRSKEMHHSLNQDLLENIQKSIMYCKEKQLPLPRVLNMSLSFEAKAEDADALVAKLTQILHDHDMLLVIAAGNEKNVLGENKTVTDEGNISIRDNLEKYPELSKRLLIVGAYGFAKGNKPAEYTNLAGVAKDHTIFCLGYVMEAKILDENRIPYKKRDGAEGTSFASPRVASLAVVLGKYFPQLTMIEIKDIILKSAFKPNDSSQRRLGYATFDAEKMGHGGASPIQAWNDACKIANTPK
ncbi:MAG: S8 family serine peptidase [Alphaproteobacteria bacterium]|nr:S8 family serine peptidase [Alphaproteobacteria bacterium]